tara:strand:+ start:185 stop:439 length:255 start_codon:yes stop_codon:yes gene_type:complete
MNRKDIISAVEQHGHGVRFKNGVVQISLEPLDVYDMRDEKVKYRSITNPTEKKIKSILGYKGGGEVKKFSSGGAAVKGLGKVIK